MRKLAQKLNPTIQIIILFILCLFPLYMVISNPDEPVFLIQKILSIILIIIALILLLIDKYYFASYTILFLLVYTHGLFDFSKWLLSFNFATFSFMKSFSWPSLVYFLGGIYLLLMSISYLLNGAFTLNKKNLKLDCLIIFFSLLLFLEDGIYTFVFIAVVEFIAIDYKKLASLFLMLAKAIIMPFTFLSLALKTTLQEIPFYNYFMLLLALYVIFLIIKRMFFPLKTTH